MIFGGFVAVNMEVASTSPVTRSMLPRILDTEEVDIADMPFARGEARRFTGRAADQVRSRPQSDDRQGARPDGAARPTRGRRRGDRIAMFLLRCMSLLLALSGGSLRCRNMSGAGGRPDSLLRWRKGRS